MNLVRRLSASHRRIGTSFIPRRWSSQHHHQHASQLTREIVPTANPIDSAQFEILLKQFERKERIVLITGAGCSTESGIPDYRSPNGSYSKGHVPMKYQEFVSSELNRKRYWARSVVGFKQFTAVAPNAGHLAMADLERRGYISHIITQNVDRLHQQAGSEKVLELHGHIDQITCLSCHRLEARWAYQELLQYENANWLQQIRPVSENERRADADAELGLTNDIYEQFKVPNCLSCGGILKPSVVFFGESIPKVVTAESLRLVEEEADAIVCAGSSMQVYSAYRLVLAALKGVHDESVEKRKRNSKPIYVVNIGTTRVDPMATLKMSSRVGDVFSALRAHLR